MNYIIKTNYGNLTENELFELKTRMMLYPKFFIGKSEIIEYGKEFLK